MGHKVPDKILEPGNRLGKHLISVMTHIQEPPPTIAHFDYQLPMLYCLSRFVIVVGAVGVASEQDRIYCETIVPRYIAAVADLNADELLPN